MGFTVPPVSVEPSGEFLGIDGNWYTFALSAGTPPQTLQVLPSTLIAETLLVNERGCNNSPLSTCVESRGGTFDNASSTSWERIVNGQAYSLGIDGNLGIPRDTAGYWGYDSVGLKKADGSTLSIDRQVVSHYYSPDFFVGMVGLSRKSSDISGNSQPSFLRAAYNKGEVPSLSYSYTAGKSAPDLTLGGQDLSRFHPNGVNFTMAPSGDRDLIASVQAITLNADDNTTELLSSGINMFIDTTQPYIWLPGDACDAFALAFGLERDEITDRYRVDGDAHDDNLKKNASVTFRLGNSNVGGATVDIVFPYAAFDLNFTQVDITTPKTTYMFPIRTQDNAQAYTLGRAFLQEAYLSVNYEYSNFSIYQAIPQSGDPQRQIVPLPSMDGKATEGVSTSAPTVTESSSSSGLGGGPIAGIVIGALVALGIVILAICCMRRRKRDKRQSTGGFVHTMSEAPEGPLPPELEQREVKGEPKPDYHGYYTKTPSAFHQKPYDVPVKSSGSSQRGELDSNGPYSPALSSPADASTAYHKTASELAGAPAAIPRYELPGRHPSHRRSQTDALIPVDAGPSGSSNGAVSRDGADWEHGTHLEEASVHSNGRPSMMSSDSVIILQHGSPSVTTASHTGLDSRVVSSHYDEGHSPDIMPNMDPNILAATSHAFGTNTAEPLSPTNPMAPLMTTANRSQETLVGSHGEGGGRDSRVIAPETPDDDFMHNSPEHGSLGYGGRWQRPQ